MFKDVSRLYQHLLHRANLLMAKTRKNIGVLVVEGINFQFPDNYNTALFVQEEDQTWTNAHSGYKLHELQLNTSSKPTLSTFNSLDVRVKTITMVLYDSSGASAFVSLKNKVRSYKPDEDDVDFDETEEEISVFDHLEDRTLREGFKFLEQNFQYVKNLGKTTVILVVPSEKAMNIIRRMFKNQSLNVDLIKGDMGRKQFVTQWFMTMIGIESKGVFQSFLRLDEAGNRASFKLTKTDVTTITHVDGIKVVKTSRFVHGGTSMKVLQINGFLCTPELSKNLKH